MEEMRTETTMPQQGLYDPSFEHDACGIGAVVDIKGRKTHTTVDNALKIVEKLEHRAGKDAEGKTGDGVGIMLQISHSFFSKAAGQLGIDLGEERDYGIGMFFFPQNTLARGQAKKMFEIIVEREGMTLLGWRTVPIQPEVLGQKAVSCMPYIEQAFIARPEGVKRGLEFDRKLYIARRVFEQSNDNTYVVSCSSRTIVYKGMFLVSELRKFYPDLQDEDYRSAIAMVHSRFSTNTNPSWERAHPNRFILHNGEINTIRGNVDRMLAREETMHSTILSEDDLDKVYPVINPVGSDSARLDNTLEFLVMNGIELPMAVMLCIPEPWVNDKNMSRAKRDMYRYYATMMEPWDGPAAILFSDGDCVGAVLDRNGLRPSRYYITDDDQLILSSEVGVLEFPAEKIVKKSRLQPGRMLLVDTKQQRLIEDEEMRAMIKGSGIGTSATRAGILEKLVRNQYLALNKKTQIFTPTQIGEMIFDVVRYSIGSMLNPKLTASWEMGLSGVADGSISKEEYTQKLNRFVTKHTEDVKERNYTGELRRCFDYAAAYYKPGKGKAS